MSKNLEKLVISALHPNDAVGWDLLRTWGEEEAARHILQTYETYINSSHEEACRELAAGLGDEDDWYDEDDEYEDDEDEDEDEA